MAYTKSIPANLQIAALLMVSYKDVQTIVRELNNTRKEFPLYVNGKYQMLPELCAFGGETPTPEYLRALEAELWTTETIEVFRKMLAMMDKHRGFNEVNETFTEYKRAYYVYRDIVRHLTNLAIEAGLLDKGYSTVRYGLVDSYDGEVEFDMTLIGKIVAKGHKATGNASVVNSGYVSFTLANN